MDGIVECAKAFAAQRHEGILRSGKAKVPYAVHLRETALLVQASGGTKEEIAAAWLHDVVEDTSTSIEEIMTIFGTAVAEIVNGVTNPPEFKGVRKLRKKKLQAEKIRTQSNSVKRVKIADLISNVRDLATDPPTTWTHQDCRDYARGAQLVARECRGISDYLDAEFTRAYCHAIKKHS